VAGGKGRASRKTPAELERIGAELSLDGSALAYARVPRGQVEHQIRRGVAGDRRVRLDDGSPASVRDPARFSFAHGGKDGHPYPVDQPTYDASIEWLEEAISRARVGRTDRVEALRRLARWQAS
jgi:hypothetical protein